MVRKEGDRDLSPVKNGEILFAVKYTDQYDAQIAHNVGCNPQTVANNRKRVYESDKENINPEDLLATKKPRTGRPHKLDSRDERRLVRYATKNRFQRKKAWTKIAHEIGTVASKTCIRNTFTRLGYIRRPPHTSLL